MNTMNFKQYPLLVVDDDEISLLGITKYLRYQGCQVYTAESAEQAITQIQHKSYALVITDLIMQGEDGIKVLKSVKAKDPDTCVIIITGYGDLKSAIDALRLGADDYLLKPVEPEDLYYRIKRCLNNLKLKREKKNAEEMLQKTLDELEDRVAVRTEELTRAKQSLQKEVAERKINQQRLRKLSSEIILAEERERRRIAEALHDQIGQTLAVAKLKLSDMRRAKDLKVVHCESLNDISGLLTEMIQDLRTLTFEISPPILYQFGIIAAINWLIESMQTHHSLKILLEYNNLEIDQYLSDSARIQLFRSIRELLFNVVKHSQACTANISIQLDEVGQIQFDIEDDGIGFNVSQLNENTLNQKSYGLFSIFERMKDLGGGCQVQSQLGKGARFTLKLPVVRQLCCELD